MKIKQMLLGIAVVGGIAVALTAPAPAGAHQSPYAALGCDCQATTPASATQAEVERGIRDGLSANR